MTTNSHKHYKIDGMIRLPDDGRVDKISCSHHKSNVISFFPVSLKTSFAAGVLLHFIVGFKK